MSYEDLNKQIFEGRNIEIDFNEEIAYELMKICDIISLLDKVVLKYNLNDYEDIWSVAKTIFARWKNEFAILESNEQGYIQEYALRILKDI